MFKVVSEKQHSPEQRATRAQIFDTHFQKSERMPNFLSEDLRVAYFDSLTVNDFITWLKEVNGLLTANDLQPSDFIDDVSYVEEKGLTGEVAIETMPAPEDKEELLGYVLAAAQSAEGIETKAMILGFGINAVHPFRDGNGRTSRLIHTLFSHGYELGSPWIKKAILDRENTELVIAPSIFSRMINTYLSEQMHSTIQVGGKTYPKVLVSVKDGAFNEADEYNTPRRETTPDEMHTMVNIFADNTIGPIVANLLELKATYRSVRSAFKQNGPRQKFFYADLFLTDANDEELGLAYQFFREATSTRVKMFVDILAGRQYANVPVAGRSKIGEIYTYQEFGKRAASGAMLRGVSLKTE